MIDISPLRESDHERWLILARNYKKFYGIDVPDSLYGDTWRRLLRRDTVHGLAARHDGRVIGIAHYLFHAHLWMDSTCYLQDLFVDESWRRRGVARALIERVAEAAAERGGANLYWLTHRDNAVARVLYERLAIHEGFIRYDYSARRIMQTLHRSDRPTEEAEAIAVRPAQCNDDVRESQRNDDVLRCDVST